MISSFASRSDRFSCGLSLTMSSTKSSYSLLVNVTAVLLVLFVTLALPPTPSAPGPEASAAPLLLPLLARPSGWRGVSVALLLLLPTAAAAAVAAATAWDLGVEPDRWSLIGSCKKRTVAKGQACAL